MSEVMKHAVVRPYTDIAHKYHKYNIYDIYPAKGYEETRIDLLTNNEVNKYNQVYIKALDKFSKNELLEIAEKNKVEIPKSALKNEIIDLLNA
ncbi:hypothetical protein [Staphylococcus aureus]|uniref:hypothetical protein n=1 Tax=Staphylococcus aureus TaxID=1280 RepID=UPI00215CB660|nr:hypothetical protein [Staphylococcus aureus]UVJ28294.1 hypothetical protein NW963_11640 [Staphylococcus aureus]